MFADNWYNVVSDIRNEVVFAGRNKMYGAYQIRTEYNHTMSSIVLSMVAAFLLAIGIKYFMDYYKPSDAEPVNVKIDITQIDLTPQQTEKNDPPPPQPPQPPRMSTPIIETIKFVPPVIVDEPIDADNMPPQDSLYNINIGAHTQTVNVDGEIPIPDDKTFTDVIDHKPPDIFLSVQEMPEFPGGTVEMMKYIQKNIVYPSSAIESGVSGKCFLRFVVNEDGKISDVEVLKGVHGCPECDKEAIRVVKSMPAWRPGKQNGKEVKVYFQLPINFVIK